MTNVLLIMSDEHNARVWSGAGHPTVRTPALDRLAREGTTYEAAYCPAPLCMPSRTAMLTGRRASDINVFGNCQVNLDPAIETYADVLRAGGVHAAYIGKTHAHAPPDDLGFAEMLEPYDEPSFGVLHRRNPVPIADAAINRRTEWGPRADAAAPDRVWADTAIDWLKRAGSIESPWTLTLNLLSPHFPLWAPLEHWDRYPEAADLPERGIDEATARHPAAVGLRRHFRTTGFSDEQQRGMRRGYISLVSHLDEQIGRVLDALDETGLAGDTLVLYTSDHGDMLGNFGLWWKCVLLEDAVRVPLIARGPGFDPSVRVRTPVDLHDARAAMFAAVGVGQPHDWLGAPLQGLDVDDPTRVAFSEYHGHGQRGSSYMIRRGRWKFVHYIREPDQLFDLDADPGELVNLAENRPDVVELLMVELRARLDPLEVDRRAEAFIERQIAHIEARS